MDPIILNLKPIQKTLLLMLFLGIALFTKAQNTIPNPELKSRISLSITQDKTSIWISDFPKNTTIVLFDEDYHLLSILSTNEFGAGFTRLPLAYNSRIYAKTLHGTTLVEAIMPDKVNSKSARIGNQIISKS